MGSYGILSFLDLPTLPGYRATKKLNSCQAHKNSSTAINLVTLTASETQAQMLASSAQDGEVGGALVTRHVKT